MRSAWAAAIAFLAFLPVAAAAQDPPKPQALAAGVWLIPGGYPPRREPDGNTVVLAAPQGLIVFDTGRRPWHRQAILDFAKGQGKPVAAIVNSHWHLDHTTGNAALRRAFPMAHVYASLAIEGALTGFLPKSAADTKAYLASGQADPETAEDLRGDLAAIADPDSLRPDRPVEHSGPLTIAGRRLQVRLAAKAATEGDVWLYDPRTRILIAGDLVTLPAPFLDTACPSGWRAALTQLWTTPFETLIPGHGPPMTRSQFATWRVAFDTLIQCAATPADKTACAGGWALTVSSLLEPGDLARKRAQQMTEYYVDVLRSNGGRSPFCEATTS